MSYVHVNGVNLFYEITGEGHPLVLVHGALSDHSFGWQPVVQGLAESVQVVTFDRRGHGRSEHPPGQRSRRQDEDDLAALIETLGLAPANVAGNSFGASVTLGLAARHPELFRTVIVHEPPLVSLLAGDPDLLPLLQDFQTENEAVVGLLKRGEIEEATKRFAEQIAIGPGSWELFLAFPEEMRRIVFDNAPIYVDEVEDPAWADIDLQALSGYRGPALLTRGDQSPPWFPIIVEKLAEAMPQAQLVTFEGAGHLPQWTHPDDFIASLIEFLSRPSYPVVRQGDVNLSGVGTVQFLLRSNPSPRSAIAADGVFGSQTEAAVRLFQTVNGLAVNGIVGRATWRKLVVTQRFGGRGEQVRAIQALLNIYGQTHAGYRLTEDGIFGQLTRAAVIRFQRAVAIAHHGVVGPVTWPFLVHGAMRVETAD